MTLRQQSFNFPALIDIETFATQIKFLVLEIKLVFTGVSDWSAIGQYSILAHHRNMDIRVGSTNFAYKVAIYCISDTFNGVLNIA